LQSLREIPVLLESTAELDRDRGAYLLVLENDRLKEVPVGGLGTLGFYPGYYVYVGSGMGSLGARTARHFRKSKKRFWHIDYLTPEHLAPVRLYLIRRTDRIEFELAKRLKIMASGVVRGFGSSDSSADSHLFFFAEPPFKNPAFLRMLLDFRTFTEGTSV
jgi:sugar fermentation stimulation protein A